MYHETAPTHNHNSEVPETSEQEYSAEDLNYIQQTAEASEQVLETAITAGEPRSDTVETSEGIKGFVESSVPGGKVEAFFDGTGSDARLEKIDMRLESDDGAEHDIVIKFKQGGQTEILLDGEQAKPEDLPAVQAVIEKMQAEQQEEAETEEEVLEKPEKTEREKRDALAYKNLVMPYLSGQNAKMAAQVLREARIDINETRDRIMSGDVAIDSNTMAIMNALKVRAAQPNSPVWHENPRGGSQLARAAAESHQLLREVVKSALR